MTGMNQLIISVADPRITCAIDVPMFRAAEIRLSEQQEAGRIRLFEHTHGFTLAEANAMNAGPFGDELNSKSCTAVGMAVEIIAAGSHDLS